MKYQQPKQTRVKNDDSIILLNNRLSLYTRIRNIVLHVQNRDRCVLFFLSISLVKIKIGEPSQNRFREPFQRRPHPPMMHHRDGPYGMPPPHHRMARNGHGGGGPIRDHRYGGPPPPPPTNGRYMERRPYPADGYPDHKGSRGLPPPPPRDYSNGPYARNGSSTNGQDGIRGGDHRSNGGSGGDGPGMDPYMRGGHPNLPPPPPSSMHHDDYYRGGPPPGQPGMPSRYDFDPYGPPRGRYAGRHKPY